MERSKKPRAPHTSPVNGMKLCAACGEIKPVSAFSPRKGGVATRCRPCRVIQHRDYRVQHQAGGEDLTAPERFWAKVEKTDGCWLWKGGVGYKGYGRFLYRGRLEQAHRMSLMLTGMKLPDKRETGLVVDHICKTPACVRPEHLRIVTQVENCGPLADPTPHWTNANKTECIKGHPLSGANLAIIRVPRRGRGPYLCRICLTCYPIHWPNAVIERAPPSSRSRRKWVGPASALAQRKSEGT